MTTAILVLGVIAMALACGLLLNTCVMILAEYKDEIVDAWRSLIHGHDHHDPH